MTKRSPVPYVVLAALALVGMTFGWVLVFPRWVADVSADRVEAAYSALEALFAGLAFLGLLSTIWIQRQELRLQRMELVQTREEMRRQAEAQEKSERALHAQAEALREEAERQARAYLRISLVPTGSSSWALEVANAGRSPAEDVRLSVDRQVWLWGRDDVLKLLSQLPLFAKGGFSIPPGFTLSYALQDGRVLSHVFERPVEQPTQFAITAHYRSNGGRRIEETSRFSLDLLEETSAGDKDFWTRQVVQALRDLKPREARARV
ncbi:MAG: DUF4200 domain-containing protein [Xanthomonadales bacterium]|nr:hypothetical protein [Xanthomonadales bacterium]MCC6593019.1 DUF4200 domain-containing protein [Xanthomonadales bacterium]